MISTQYAVQFRFKPKGHWHTMSTCFEKHIAKIMLKNNVDQAKHEPRMAKFWRIAKREVSEWQEVK